MEASTKRKVTAPGMDFAAQIRTVHIVVRVDTDDIHSIPTPRDTPTPCPHHAQAFMVTDNTSSESVDTRALAQRERERESRRERNAVNALISPPLHLFLVSGNRCHCQQTVKSLTRLGHHPPPLLLLLVWAVELGVHREHLDPLCLS